ncbi:hypothetical protein GGI07_002588 [Coemansia sp. Benny D115]|nr:hypothetical protein GGI07_002588 [Coemansia sp. Benny D115]
MDNNDVDYNMKAPLGPIVGYPCRNFAQGPIQGTMQAGHPFRVRFDGIANHLGGDCQFAVSYDNGTTFAVIWDKLASCFIDIQDGGYDVPVPDYLPAAKHAVFAWTWINGMGSREYYMNCADIRIENYGHQQPLTAHELLVVNLPGRQSVTPKTGKTEDRLPLLLNQRPLITVGKPSDENEEKSNPDDSDKESGDGDDAHQRDEAEADPNAPASAAGTKDPATLPDEITSYVYTTHTVIEDENDDLANPDAGYVYSDIPAGLRSRSNGLAAATDDGFEASLLAHHLSASRDTFIPFDMDDTMPMATHHLTGLDNFDVWPSSSAATLAAADMSMVSAILTASVPMASEQSTSHSTVTQYRTVTMNGKPLLQVVVSSNNTAIPSSLTIAY